MTPATNSMGEPTLGWFQLRKPTTTIIHESPSKMDSVSKIETFFFSSFGFVVAGYCMVTGEFVASSPHSESNCEEYNPSECSYDGDSSNVEHPSEIIMFHTPWQQNQWCHACIPVGDNELVKDAEWEAQDVKIGVTVWSNMHCANWKINNNL